MSDRTFSLKWLIVVLIRAFVACAFFGILACTPKTGADKAYLYNKTGFDAGTMPQNMQEPNAPNRVAPDYYYRQPQNGYSQQGYAPVQQQPSYYYQQQPPQYTTYGYPQNGYAPRGGSRFYSNPYAIPPSSQYPSYDADQYYVPPAYYNNVEPTTQNNDVLKSSRPY